MTLPGPGHDLIPPESEAKSAWRTGRQWCGFDSRFRPGDSCRRLPAYFSSPVFFKDYAAQATALRFILLGAALGADHFFRIIRQRHRCRRRDEKNLRAAGTLCVSPVGRDLRRVHIGRVTAPWALNSHSCDRSLIDLSCYSRADGVTGHEGSPVHPSLSGWRHFFPPAEHDGRQINADTLHDWQGLSTGGLESLNMRQGE